MQRFVGYGQGKWFSGLVQESVHVSGEQMLTTRLCFCTELLISN